MVRGGGDGGVGGVVGGKGEGRGNPLYAAAATVAVAHIRCPPPAGGRAAVCIVLLKEVVHGILAIRLTDLQFIVSGTKSFSLLFRSRRHSSIVSLSHPATGCMFLACNRSLATLTTSNSFVSRVIHQPFLHVRLE